MSPSRGRPPIDNPKSVRLEIRMTPAQAETLTDCAKMLGVSRTDVIIRGIGMVMADLRHEDAK